MKSLITKPLGKKQREVIEDLRTHGRPTAVAWISLRCKMRESDANKVLSGLVTRGLVRRMWISRVAYYSLTVEVNDNDNIRPRHSLARPIHSLRTDGRRAGGVMRYASVCDGISAASVAWHSLGWSCAWVSEIDPFACAVIKERWRDHQNVGDMLAVNERIRDRGPIDLLVGGTPCQSFSVAGLRRGLDDARGNLALRFCQLAGLLRPRWVVWENVPGVLSSNRGRDFGTILGALEQLGYGIAYRVLDAQFFGVPQRRRRVFVVGYLGDWRRSAAVLFDRQSLRWDSATRGKNGKGVAALTATGVGTCGADDNQAQAGHLIASTVTAKWAKGTGGPSGNECQNLIAHTLRGEGFDASEDGTGRGTPLVPVAFSSKNDGGDVSDVSPTLRAMNHAASHANAGGQVAVAYQCQGSNVGPMGTLRAGNGNETGGVPFVPVAFQTSQSGVRVSATHATLDANNGSRRHNGIARGLSVRRLTPRECERLQGFPDDYTLVTYRGKPAADGPRYRAIGNSMAVPVMRRIGERIAFVDQIGKAVRHA